MQTSRTCIRRNLLATEKIRSLAVPLYEDLTVEKVSFYPLPATIMAYISFLVYLAAWLRGEGAGCYTGSVTPFYMRSQNCKTAIISFGMSVCVSARPFLRLPVFQLGKARFSLAGFS
jgi:hypothetical protein